MQAADVIMGKKDADDAAKDMAKTVGTITAAGGAYQAALTMTLKTRGSPPVCSVSGAGYESWG